MLTTEPGAVARVRTWPPRMPQRGCALQPNVAPAATLGMEAIEQFSTATRLRHCIGDPQSRHNRVAVAGFKLPFPRVAARGGNPGL